jgi:hypothetical protein
MISSLGGSRGAALNLLGDISMIRSLLVCAAAGLLILPAGCQKVELQDFSPDGTFKVLMPSKTEEKSQMIGGMKSKMWIAEYNDGALFVAKVDVPGGDKMSRAEQESRLKSGQSGAISNVKGNQTSESEITLAGKYPGRSFEAKVKVPKKRGGGEVDGVLKARIYFAGDKLYMVYAIGTPTWIGGAEISRFLDSLQILK